MTLRENREAYEQSRERLLSILPAYISEETQKAIIELCHHVSPDMPEQEQFAQQCLAYTRDFILRYPQIAEALFMGDELGGTAKQRRMHARALQQYQGRDVRRGDLWNGAGEHTLMLGMLAEILAKEMKLPPDAVKRVALAGGVHDWWKKHEITRMWDAEDALAQSGTPVSKETMLSPAVVSGIRGAFDAAKREDQERLRTLGFSDDIIALAGMNRLHDAGGPHTDEELIIFCLDHLLAGVRPTDMLKRIRNAVGGNPSYAAYEASFRGQLGGRTSHELLLENGLGVQVLERLAQRLKYTGSIAQLHEHITELFVRAVRSHA